MYNTFCAIYDTVIKRRKIEGNMAKAKNKVISGIYKNFNVILDCGHVKIFSVWEQEKTTILRKFDIQSIIPVNATQNKDMGSSIARGLVGGFLLGPAGLIGGAILGKNNEVYVLQVTFKSGASCLIEVDGKIYQEILKIMY